MNVLDTGREFEERAMSVARAIYDPLGMQGSVIHKGQERDGLFVTDLAITAFEFTTDRKKEKADKDARKLAQLLEDLSSTPEHRHKSTIGYFVTANEPTAEQRTAVDLVSRNSRQQLQALSLLQLQKQMIDTESYIRLRLQAPFGSTLTDSNDTEQPYVEPTLSTELEKHSLDHIVERTLDGATTVIVADYGAGKSEALRQSFKRLRRKFFRSSGTARLPIHVNLNDCRGLRTPHEVLRRHSEDIGFADERSLIAAWRSGNTILLLDGFDELVPTRWVGGARDLKQVRKQALEPVRRLITETPPGSGILIAGRPQYFSTTDELSEALGLSDPLVAELKDFDSAQVQTLAGDVGIPAWVPTRPLMIKFYISTFTDHDSVDIEPEIGWRELLTRVATREADRIGSLTRESVKRLICRIATMARSAGDSLGPISVDEMRNVFADICGYEPEEEGLQLLLRLPGLISSTSPTSSYGESRKFVDVDFADAAYGEDLAAHLASPHSSHPLGSGIAWNTASSELSAGVAAQSLAEQLFEPGHVSFAIKKRMDEGRFDAVLLDTARTADAFEAPFTQDSHVLISEVIIENLRVSAAHSHISQSQFVDCIVNVLDLTELEDSDNFPSFRNCIIGTIEGWGAIPKRYESHLIDCEIARLSGRFDTTGGLLDAGATVDDSIALTILKKVYRQKGAGRKSSSLSRGLPPHEKGKVPSVIAALESQDLIRRISRGNEEIVVAVQTSRDVANRILDAPAGFSLGTIS